MSRRKAQYDRYKKLIEGRALPLAIVDLDAVDRNLEALLAPVRAAKKTLRIASKSIRCVELLRYALDRGGGVAKGIMAYSCAEAGYLAGAGFDDLLIAYPTAQSVDAEHVADANRRGARVMLAVDDLAHLAIASTAATAQGATIPIVVDIDASYRPGGLAHIGVRRSPLHDADAVADLVERIASYPGLSFGGLLAYEAHIAGLPDASRTDPLFAGVMRALKSVARQPVADLRAAISLELSRRGIAVPLFNGGGTGSVAWSAKDPALTEIAAGSGILDSHLFDHYRGLDLEPAAFFALQITRRPSPDYLTCHGGGFIASGAAGVDRLPLPWLPEGLALTAREGAGEVQTPLRVAQGGALRLGDPVFFRHAKAGELAEHFAQYLLVRGDRVEAEVSTYRGAGKAF